MTWQGDDHLAEAELIRSLLDDEALPAAVHEHLSGCLVCRAEQERIKKNLKRLGDLALRFSPAPLRKVVLPSMEAPDPRRVFDWKRRWSYMAGAIAASVLVFALGFAMLGSSPDVTITKLNNEEIDEEILEDEELMIELARLEENALPPLFLDIYDDSDLDLDREVNDDEGLMDEEKPSEPDGPSFMESSLSGEEWKRGKLC